MRFGSILAGVCLLAAAVSAQEMPKPGPEHEKLKEMVGTWDAVCKDMQGKAFKGVSVAKVDLGGFWVTSEFTAEIDGHRFTGRALDGYDPTKKKYVSVWVDSMSPGVMVLEGGFDTDGKVLTMTGEGPSPEGKPVRYTMVSKFKDKDTFEWSMSIPGPEGKDVVLMSAVYTRRK